MSYLIKERMMRDKAYQDDSVTLGDSAVGLVVKNVSAKKEEGTKVTLFEVIKEKVEVADNHLPAVVENAKSSLNIDRLPNEMLEKIFEILIQLENDDGSNGNSKRINNIESYLSCRLVSTRWKFWMESVLEKKSISILKVVPISRIKSLEADPPALGHLFVHQTEDEFTPVKWTVLPPPLESWDGKGSPFPSHSLKLTSHSEYSDGDDLLPSPRPSRAQLVRLTDFFSKFGEHLTSLILTSVTLSTETFIGILENTPKLKALTLNTVVFRGNLVNCAPLPALEHLRHLRVFYVKIMLKKADARDLDFPYNNDKKIKLYYWILSPFIQQLLTLNIDGQSGIGTVANFANLERLIIFRVSIYHVGDHSFLQRQFFLYPRLKSLFLTHVEIRWNRDILEWFQQDITPFVETLVELHLAIPYGYSGGLNRAGSLSQHPPKSTQKKTNEVVFRELKTFEITFPKYPEEVEAIKALIKMFPKLEALTFLDRKYGVDAVNVVDLEEYKKVCPTLKKIRIRDL